MGSCVGFVVSTRTRQSIGALLIVSAVVASPAPAAATSKYLEARRTTGPISIDGRLTEADWVTAPKVGGFWQSSPHEGASAQLPTEFSVLFDNEAIYVGVWAHDDSPSEIRGMLTRRDQDSTSDWVIVAIDSHDDKRTAYGFALNPAGVQFDMMLLNDVEEDAGWDAVWEGATTTDVTGWVVEFRIPFSQLRFANRPLHEWGIQVQRIVQRTREITFWSPAPSDRNQLVSLFGRVGGIRDIPRARRLELLPYTSGGLRVEEGDAGDPFHEDAGLFGGVGVDVKYGLTSDLTLSAAINPDFGQVEADPSEVNLTASETFFQEKRPFFLEGADLFQFGLGRDGASSSEEQLFYSRRIGAPPHLTGRDFADYADEDRNTSIYGAAKLSGRIAHDWSLGTLAAVTGEESARIAPSPGEVDTVVIEPLSAFNVLRLDRALDEGRTRIGGIVTTVHRRLGGTGIDTLHDRAYAGGLGLTHRDASGHWSLGARLLASHVHGEAAAIDTTQRASQRYFQRPGSDYLGYDPTRTALDGLAGQGHLLYLASERWSGSTGVDSRSPGFEVNDLGFQHLADYVTGWGSVQYRDAIPGKRLRRWSAKAGAYGTTSWEPQFLSSGGSAEFDLVLQNLWGTFGGASVDANVVDTRLLRGGPQVAGHTDYNAWLGVFSDERKRIRFQLNSNLWLQPLSDSWRLSLDGAVVAQPRSNLEISVGPLWSVGEDDLQFVDTYTATDNTLHYTLARLEQTTAALTLRMSYALSPRLSLQVYAQPFISAGRFTEYKEADNVEADAYADRFHVFAADELIMGAGTLGADRNKDGVPEYEIVRPDFNVRQLRSTVVARWEYRPGSTLFVIWNHNRDRSSSDDRLRLGHDLAELGSGAGEHVLLLKLSYWWAP